MVQLSDIKDYWSFHQTLNFPFLRSVFSRDRFLQIFWMLHVADTMSPMGRSKIQPFLDMIIPLFQSYLTPSHEISVNKAMIAFRWRVFFRQCIRGKPQPWSIKAYVLSDRLYVQYAYLLLERNSSSYFCFEPYYKRSANLDESSPEYGIRSVHRSILH